MAFSKALYFVALVPPPQIKEEVKNLKLEMKESFNSAHALKLPAHITLIPPVWLKGEQEKIFLEAIRDVAHKQSPFQIGLKDFGRFGQRVIYIGVKDPLPVKRLYHKLTDKLKDFLPEEKRPGFHPHITIATRDLNRESSKKAWEQFKERRYEAEFKATSLTIFKHNKKTWDILETAGFAEKPD